MRKILMHKDIEVAVVEFEDGKITGLTEILNKKHMPVGTCAPGFSYPFCNVYLQAWQRGRAVPEDRLNLAEVVRSAGMDIYQLAELSHGMALTDCYWLKNPSEELAWDEISFHRNGFSPSLLTLSGSGKSTSNPDYETNGCLPKSWLAIDDIPVLIKDSPPWLPTASANEVVASRIANECGIEHAVCFPAALGNKTYSASVNIIDCDKEELVFFQVYKRTCRGSNLETAKKMGLTEDFLNTMNAFDLLLGNTDRHEGNFGMLMNPDTMKFLRPASLFDSGNCLCGSLISEDGIFKPFYRNQAEALQNLSSLSFPLPSIDICQGIIRETYEEFGLSEYANQAVEEIRMRIETLEEREIRRKDPEEDLCL